MSSVSLGFPFWNLPRFSFSSSSARKAAIIAALAAGSAAALAVTFSSSSEQERNSSSRIRFASLSLAELKNGEEAKNGREFPREVDGGRRLLGVGMRRSNVLGLKSIDVYSFGVYADESDVKKLAKENGIISISDTLENDIKMTVRLQIVYSRLSIKSVRNAFGKSVGNRLQKFNDGSSDTNDLLQKFVSMFKDEQKLPKGSVIELSREEGFVLQTKIDGKEVGRIQSKLLCKSILDLYLGDDPFDKRAKDEIQLNLATKPN